MSERQGKERRRFPRIPIEVQVEGIQGESRFYLGKTRDLSVGGLFVEIEPNSEVEPEPEMGMQVSFRLPGAAAPMDVGARVARIIRNQAGQLSGLGIEFVSMSDETRTALEAMSKLTSGPS